MCACARVCVCACVRVRVGRRLVTGALRGISVCVCARTRVRAHVCSPPLSEVPGLVPSGLRDEDGRLNVGGRDGGRSGGNKERWAKLMRSMNMTIRELDTRVRRSKDDGGDDDDDMDACTR